MVNQTAIERFLAQRSLAVVGASDDPKHFGGTVYRELRDHGYEVVAVNSTAATVAGDPCYPDLASVPRPLDGVVVMVAAARAADVVREAAVLGIRSVWLFKGLGGAGAVSAEALEACREMGIDVVAGACPLMFLDPVGWFHRVHRGIRRYNGTLTTA